MPYLILTPTLFQEVPVSLNRLILLIFYELMGFFLIASGGLKRDLPLELVQILVVILDVTFAKLLKVTHPINILLNLKRLLRKLILIFKFYFVFLRNFRELLLFFFFFRSIHRLLSLTFGGLSYILLKLPIVNLLPELVRISRSLKGLSGNKTSLNQLLSLLFLQISEEVHIIHFHFYKKIIIFAGN